MQQKAANAVTFRKAQQKSSNMTLLKGSVGVFGSSPLCPDERTSSVRLVMYEKCHVWVAPGCRPGPSVDERLRRRKPKSVRVRHRLAGDLAVADIEAVT